jgi:hypothetical protein
MNTEAKADQISADEATREGDGKLVQSVMQRKQPERAEMKHIKFLS